MRKAMWGLLVIVVSLGLTASWSVAVGKEPTRVGKETVRDWINNPEVMILDVRQPGDWLVSGKKIKGAVREDPNRVARWAPSLPRDKKIVLYCD